MSVQQTGDTFVLTGNGQSAAVMGLPNAAVFAYGSGDTVDVDYTTNSTIDLFGRNETICQYGGDPNIIINGWVAGDTLSVYALFQGAGGVALPRGSGPTAASLRPDGHNGYIAQLAYGQGTIDFRNTSEWSILSSHSITASVR